MFKEANDYYINEIRKVYNDFPFEDLNSKIINNAYGCHGKVNYTLLESAVYAGENHYIHGQCDDLLRIICIIAFRMAKNHCFTDGNKRTSLIFMLTLLKVCDLYSYFDPEEIANVFESMVDQDDIEILYKYLSNNIYQG